VPYSTGAQAWIAHHPFTGLEPLKSVTRGQCDARPTVTFPAAKSHRPLTGTKLLCLVTGVQGCEQLANRVLRQSHSNRQSNPRPLDRKSNVKPVAPPRQVVTSSSAAAERPREPLSQLKSCQLHAAQLYEKSHLTRRIALSCGIKISPVGSLD